VPGPEYIMRICQKVQNIRGMRARESKQEVIMIKTDIVVFKTSRQPLHSPTTFPFTMPTFPWVNSKINKPF